MKTSGSTDLPISQPLDMGTDPTDGDLGLGRNLTISTSNTESRQTLSKPVETLPLTGTDNCAFQALEEVKVPVVSDKEEGRVMAGRGKVMYTKLSGTEQSPLLQHEQLQDPAAELKKNPSSFRISQVILFLVFLVAGVALTGGLVFGLVTFVAEEDDLQQQESQMAGMGLGPGELSATEEFRFAAVAADAGQCSEIGTDIMALKRGSVVDAAIASLLCLGIHNSQSMGIGGGHFMMIYDRPKHSKERQMFSLDSRETAPAAATVNMYAAASSSKGGLAVAVPGEIKGMHAAWRRFGRLPWSDLFEPTIRMCRDGYTVAGALGEAIQSSEQNIRESEMLSEIYVKKDGTLYKEGDTMTRPKLADTLERIAKDGADTFYNGTLADDIKKDLDECGGIITKKDLRDYKALWRTPSVSHLQTGNYSVYTMPAPSSGPVVQYMLNILEGYDMKPSDIAESSPAALRTLTYHRIAETLKFGYARRSFLGDPDFEDISELAANLTKRSYADLTRSHIRDDQTQDVDYYHPANHAIQRSAGTSHLSIIGADGGAVAATSTINTYFGSKCRGRRTGIIFNNEMDDFNTPGDEVEEGFSTASANFIAPGKRPLSSMVPTIILNQKGDPEYIVGGSGGKLITSETTYVTAHALWLGKKLNEAIDHPRIHHQLLPNELQYEPQFDKEVLEGLKAKGHVLKEKGSLAVIQGIYSCRHHCEEPSISATSDVRKGGYPDGY